MTIFPQFECQSRMSKFFVKRYPAENNKGIISSWSSPSTIWTWSLQWRHNDHDGVSKHQPHGCLLNRLFGRRSKKTSKLRVTGLCAGNSPGPVNSPHKGPVTRKMFPIDDVIMKTFNHWSLPYRKCPDYVYVKLKYQSTMTQIKYYLRRENNVSENKILSYCEALRYMWNII